MIVEIVGPAGSGKTTIAEGLDDSFRESDATARYLPFVEYEKLNREIGEVAIMRRGRIARWLSLFPMCWHHPRLVLYVAALTILHGRPILRRARKAQRLLAHVLFTERLQALHADRICVQHDGFTQCLWSMLIDSTKLRGQGMVATIMRDYYEWVEPRVILLEIDDKLTAQRVFGRISKGRFNQDSPPRRRAEFERWIAYHRELVALLPANLERTSVDANFSPEVVAAASFHALGFGESMKFIR